MANESKFEIKGNFLVVSNVTSRNEFFRVQINGVKFKRFPNDEFMFLNDAPTVNNYGAQELNVLGINTLVTIANPNPESRTTFTFADSVDKDGVPFPSADAFDIWLSENLGCGCGDSGGLTEVSTDATLTGNGTVGNPLSVVSGDNYQERWDNFNANLTGAFHTVSVPGSPPNRIIGVFIDPQGNNTTVGVRTVGSALLKVTRIDNDSSAYFTTKTNEDGEIEVYTTNVNADFFVESYQN